MSVRSIRRAAEHKARKAAAKVLRQNTQPTPPPPVETPAAQPAFPEPGAPFPLLSEITPARLAANRENALLSTGPKTDEGKAASSQNRLTHGLARHNGRFAMIAGEDPAEFAGLLNNYLAEHLPVTQTEVDLVHAMAESIWLRNRAQNLQPTCFDPNTGLVADQKALSLYIRYENQYTRAHSNALKDLLRGRAESRRAQLGFEAQQREIRAQEKHQMKKDAHYWDVLKKDAEACFQLTRNLSQKMDAMQQNPDFLTQLEAEFATHNVKPSRFDTAIAA